MTELSLTSCCVPTLGSELRITQLHMRKHTRCCSLQTSTANPYSRGTSPQTVPSSSTKGTRPVWPNFPTNNWAHPHSWQQITDQPYDTEQIKTQLHTDTSMRTYTKVQNKPKQNTRPAQHMSCSPGQVLNFWRAHSPSPPNSFWRANCILLVGLELQGPDIPLRGVSTILRRNLISNTTCAIQR